MKGHTIEKRETVLAEVARRERLVPAIARRHNLTPNTVYAWCDKEGVKYLTLTELRAREVSEKIITDPVITGLMMNWSRA